MCRFRIVTFIVTALIGILSTQAARADTFGSGANTFSMEFVPIGSPNDPDTSGDPNPAGSVAYPFYMGKFEVSEDMITKANAEGALGITKNTRGPDKPATSVSWNEAARFVNWLNTSQGFTPAYKFATQPGDGGYSANANIDLWMSGDAGFDASNPFRNSLAHYWLPSVDEWYKAAYYDPVADVYYNYPTGSDSVPDGIDFAGDPSFDAVFRNGGFNTDPNDITDVGVLSPFGTAGQGGNVFEWEETTFDLLNMFAGSSRGVRGGDWGNSSIDLLSSNRDDRNPTFGFFDVGFRVASLFETTTVTPPTTIPEPTTILIAALGLLGMGWLSRRRRKRA